VENIRCAQVYIQRWAAAADSQLWEEAARWYHSARLCLRSAEEWIKQERAFCEGERSGKALHGEAPRDA